MAEKDEVMEPAVLKSTDIHELQGEGKTMLVPDQGSVNCLGPGLCCCDAGACCVWRVGVPSQTQPCLSSPRDRQ
jgi:hypothetical protein